MKKLLLSCLIFWALNTVGQVLPVSSNSHDQLVQGPCYIFATVAALETEAIKAGYSNADLYEWNLYSKAVLGSRSGNGDNMVTKVLKQATDYGIYDRIGAYSPSINTLPNGSDLTVPGIADFTGCLNSLALNNYYYPNEFEGTCVDDENQIYAFEPFEGYKYIYSSAIDYTVINNPSILQMASVLNNGHGLIAFFNNWIGSTSHAIYIYGRNGSNWYYKDSWPNDHGNKYGTLDLSKCSKVYYLTGSISSNAPASCSAIISGNSTVSGNTTYNISGNNISNVNWSVSSNLTIVNQNSTSITVKPTSCTTGSGNISATYYQNLEFCSTSKNVSISGGSLAPNGISVLSYDWSNGETCPNTTLELNVIDNNNPAYPQTTYDWSISGATLLSGNGTETVFVKTADVEWTNYLTFKVRAKYGSCSYSAWTTLYGTADPSNCSGGGSGVRFDPNFETRNSTSSHDQLEYFIISLDGKVLDRGIYLDDKSINYSCLNQPFVIVKITDHKKYVRTFKVSKQ